jgi:eukaryotic-like serine/threonine-protein kinase
MSAQPVRFGPFFLDRRIAVGGTAEVYLARPAEEGSNLPAKLIVKRLLPHFATDPEGRTMFDREAKLHTSVQHENVVTIFHTGVVETGEAYLAMEYVDGVDGYRLLRRLRQENQSMPIGVSVHVARQVLRALSSVHSAKSEAGEALGIVHRDISPSNIYLGKDGRIKLGDFGIASSLNRQSLRSEAGDVIKGKFAYLAPEQVAGESSDHRADLFSLAVVLAEMLLGKPVFPGAGQLAVLLAIRDCKTEALDRARDELPPGLFDVLKRALARDPAARFASAAELSEALAPFEADAKAAQKEIAAKVAWVEARGSSDALQAVRESVQAMRAVQGPREMDTPPSMPTAAVQGPEVKAETQVAPLPRASADGGIPTPTPKAPTVEIKRTPAKAAAPKSDREPYSGRATMQYALLPSFVVHPDGTKIGPLPFAKVVEALATGTIGRGDKIDYMGRGMAPIEDIEELARFLPPITAQTGKLTGPGAPDFHDDLSGSSMLDVLIRVLAQQETGVLFAEREKKDDQEGHKKELYFLSGRLHHVASDNASELLGEYLVRRGKLAREELDLALAVLPRYEGRMGDTLISLGLVGPVDIFRAIREQGRDRVADVFSWKQGVVSFYRGQQAPHVEFPLDLDLPTLLVAGVEASQPGDTAASLLKDRMKDLLEPGDGVYGDELFSLADVTWPALITRLRGITKERKPLKEHVDNAMRSLQVQPAEALRSIQILIAARLLRWV